MNGRLGLTFLALSTCGVLTFAGCGSDGSHPTGPDNGPVAIEIGPEGGTFSFAEGAVALTVPAGALPGTVSVMVAAVTTPPSAPGLIAGTCFACSPDTLVFLQQAILRLAYAETALPAGVAESSLRVHRIADGDWQEVGGSVIDAAGKTVSAPVSGFGGFGLVGTVTGEGPIYQGDYVINSEATLAAFAGYVGITGNLELASYGPETLVVPDLVTIGGRLRLFGPAQAAHTLRSASLPSLRSIGSLLQIENCDSLLSLSLPACTAVGAIDIQRNYALRNLSGLGSLIALNPENLAYHGGIQFWLNDNLESLVGLEHLTGTANVVYVRQNGALASLSGLSGISHVNAHVEIVDCPELPSLTGLQVRTVGGNCLVSSCQQLADLRGLDLLTAVGGSLQIEGCPLLEDLTGLGQLGICGLLAVQYNNGLVSFDGLGPLQQVAASSLIIRHNGQLTDIGALGFLTSVQSNLSVEYCTQLASLTGLEALNHVGGDLRLNALHALTDLNPLAQLDHAWGHLRIENCVRLTSVQGLWGLQANPATGFVCRSFYVVGNSQAGTPPTGLTNAKAEELLARIGGAAMVEGEVTITGN